MAASLHLLCSGALALASPSPERGGRGEGERHTPPLPWHLIPEWPLVSIPWLFWSFVYSILSPNSLLSPCYVPCIVLDAGSGTQSSGGGREVAFAFRVLSVGMAEEGSRDLAGLGWQEGSLEKAPEGRHQDMNIKAQRSGPGPGNVPRWGGNS